MSVQQIGRYLVERELGRGGMAAVSLARDPHMKRLVAIKVLPRQFTFDPQFRARFQREAEVIAALEHPYIVPVYDYGEHDDQPYLVMRYMPGGSLVERLRAGPVSLAEAAHLVQRLGEALDEAHRHNIIHRDLKPGNILFDARGEPFLSDFGIAKITAGGDGAGTGGVTGTGGVIGTPAYMSPEQASGDPALDGRSDLYALGVILFELLTGQLPFHADTPMGLAVAHITQPVPSILAVKPDLPPAAELVLARALAKAPADRYATGADLTLAVAQLVSGATPGAATAVAVAAPTQLPVPATVTAAPLAAAAPALAAPLDLSALTLAGAWTRHNGAVWSVAFSPDGQRLASGGEDRVAVLWETAGGRVLSLFKGHTHGVTGVAFSPDGRWLGTASQDTSARVWTVAGAQCLRVLTGPAPRVVKGVAFSPDGRLLACASWDKTVQLWDAGAGQLLGQWEHPTLVNALAFSPDGRWLASAGHDRLARIWEVGAGRVQQTLAGHTDIVSSVAFSADGRRLISGSWDRTARVWEWASGAVVSILAGHTDQVMGVAAGPDGAVWATASNDRSVRLWQNEQLTRTLTGPADAVKGVAFSPDGRRLAAASSDRAVWVWAVP